MYYLYRHIRHDKDEVFYIGIGKIPTLRMLKYSGYTQKGFYRRAYDKTKSRNPYWKNIVKKSTYDVEIIYECGTKREIIGKEREFIKLYKPTLCNLTDGGSGIDSYKHTNGTKLRISKTMKGRKLSTEHRLNINKRKFKPIIMFNELETKSFDSMNQCALYLGSLNFRDGMRRALVHKGLYKGYYFKLKVEK